MKINKGKLYLIPVPLGPIENHDALPEYNKKILHKLSHFIVEQVRTARRFISRTSHPMAIDDMTFMELNKHTDSNQLYSYLSIADKGNSIGLLSEAGTPCIADPGSQIVKLAHEKNIEIIPLVGPNSIILALMGSGFNGQSFCFHGYLPVEKSKLVKQLKEIEGNIYRNDQTQIFIETPYRNNKLLTAILSCCSDNTSLCIATDLTIINQNIISKKISEWKGMKVDLNKKPSVFLIYK